MSTRGCHVRGRLNVGSGPYALAMANFAVRLVHGLGWDTSRQTRDQDGWAEHAAFMDELVDDGFVILGGPVGNGEQTLHVVEAVNEQDVKTRFARDPWASARLLQIGVIEPWALWLDRRPKQAPKHRSVPGWTPPSRSQPPGWRAWSVAPAAGDDGVRAAQPFQAAGSLGADAADRDVQFRADLRVGAGRVGHEHGQELLAARRELGERRAPGRVPFGGKDLLLDRRVAGELERL